jgi:hypothetical protein
MAKLYYDVDVSMIAPKAPGHMMRQVYTEGSGVRVAGNRRRESGGPPLSAQRGAATTWFRGRRVDQSAPGRIRLRAVLLILAAAAGVYLVSKFVPPYWTYLGMLDPVKEAAMAMVSGPSGNEALVRADLIRRAKAQGLALEDDNIDITQDGIMLVVRVTWVTPVELPRYRYDLRFRIEERVPLR